VQPGGGFGALLALALATVGCSVPIARGLGEQDANRVVVALEREGVEASKEADEQSEGRWLVRVASEDASAATAVLAHDSLPPRTGPGVLDALSGEALVPSRTSEHARLLAGTASDLERSLQGIDGVLSARVHLAVAAQDPFAVDNRNPSPTASVLLRHRGAVLPLSSVSIQQLVAGAVPGLDPNRVSVVSTPVPPTKRLPDRQLVRLGPVTVTRGSLTRARGIMAVAVLMNLALFGLLVGLWSRLRHARLALAEAQSEPAATNTPGR
jgi:type III secretion protein J